MWSHQYIPNRRSGLLCCRHLELYVRQVSYYYVLYRIRFCCTLCILSDRFLIDCTGLVADSEVKEKHGGVGKTCKCNKLASRQFMTLSCRSSLLSLSLLNRLNHSWSSLNPRSSCEKTCFGILYPRTVMPCTGSPYFLRKLSMPLFSSHVFTGIISCALFDILHN